MRSTLSREARGSKGFSLVEVVVALAILAVGIVTLVQLLSGSLRTTKNTGDYSKALVYARSLMDEAYGKPGVMDIEGAFELEGGFAATRAVRPVFSGENTAAYEITVTVTWPPTGRVEIRGIKTVYEKES